MSQALISAVDERGLGSPGTASPAPSELALEVCRTPSVASLCCRNCWSVAWPRAIRRGPPSGHRQASIQAAVKRYIPENGLKDLLPKAVDSASKGRPSWLHFAADYWVASSATACSTIEPGTCKKTDPPAPVARADNRRHPTRAHPERSGAAKPGVSSDH